MRCGAQEEEKLAVASSSKAASRFAYDVLQAGEGGTAPSRAPARPGEGTPSAARTGTSSWAAAPTTSSPSPCRRLEGRLHVEVRAPAVHPGPYEPVAPACWLQASVPSDSHLVWCQHDCMHGFPAGACMRCLHTLS